MKEKKLKDVYSQAIEKLQENFKLVKKEITQEYKKSKKEIDTEYQSVSQKQRKEKLELRKKVWNGYKNSLKWEFSFFVKKFLLIFLLSVFANFVFQKISLIDIYILITQNSIFIFYSKSFISQILIFLLSILCLYLLFHIFPFLCRVWRTNNIRIFTIILVFTILYWLIIGFLWYVIFSILGVICCGLIQLYSIEYRLQTQEKKEWLLLSDNAVEKPDDDRFWNYKDKKPYEKLYELIKNNESTDNQVFGLTAEWGTGKSSLLNLMKNTAKEHDNIIFVDFNPWYYESEKELLEKLFDEIVSSLKDHKYYTWDISRKFSDFTNILQENSHKFFGFSIPFYSLFFWRKSLAKQKVHINNFLKKIPEKIVIIIDDLDRITSDKFIEILKIVDLVRDFHNTSFVLCYDPQNFNSIDTQLIQTQITQEQKVKQVETQKINNAELIRYMDKIITVNVSVNIHPDELKQEFKRYIGEYNKKHSFWTYSIKAMKKSIDDLFLFKNYKLWGRSLKNMRGVKRIVNFIITSLVLSKKDDDNEAIQYFDETFWVKFDVFIKLLILQMHYFHLYKDIENEISVSESIHLNRSKYIFNLYGEETKKEENQEYIDYLDTLPYHEQQLLKDLFPIREKNYQGINDREKYQLRDWNTLKIYIDLLTGNSKEIQKDIQENRFVLEKIGQYLKKEINAKDALDEVFKKWGIDYINNFLRKLPDELAKQNEWGMREERAFMMVDAIVQKGELYEYDNDFTFYLDIARILDVSISYNSNTKPENISEYVYGNKWDTSLPIWIMERWKELWKEQTMKWLMEWLRVLLATDKSRWGSFDNFERAIDRNEIYKIIYPYFEKNYINSDTNFIQYVYEFEDQHEKRILWHLLYMLLHYAPNETKKSLTEYFIKWFKIEEEYFLRWITRNLEEERNKPVMLMWDIIEYFDEDIMKSFIVNNYDEFMKWLSENQNKNIKWYSKYVSKEELIFSYEQVLQMYQKAYKEM